MVRMSRAGRKAMMFKALLAHDRKHRGGALTTAQLAHAAGLKSSTNVVNMLKEQEAFGRIKEVHIQPTYDCGYTVRAWAIADHEQLPLPDRFIVINGIRWNLNTNEVA